MSVYELKRQDALLLAAELPISETVSRQCPACGRNKFTVTRTAEGVLWNCFRPSCVDHKGRTGGAEITRGALVAPTSKGKPKLRPWNGNFWPLTIEDVEYFGARFGITDPAQLVYLRRTRNYDSTSVGFDEPFYAISCPNVHGRTWGHVIRRACWHGKVSAPGDMLGSGLPADYPKARTRAHTESSGLAAYFPFGTLSDDHRDIVLLVEDPLSAMRAATDGIAAVALLGTQLDPNKVRDISLLRPKKVVIALDKDATTQAFRLAKKWGLAWPEVRVLVLEQDIKDLDTGIYTSELL